MLQTILQRGPDWSDQIHLRFGGWVFHYLSVQLFGLSEGSYFLPNWLVSASLGPIAFSILTASGYPPRNAFLGGLLVVTAPFEIFIGTVHANDLILSWCVSLSVLAIVRLRERPVLQGVCLALLLWFAFYVKLWAVYFIPALVVYYLAEFRRTKAWSGVGAFILASACVHGATLLVWKCLLGEFLPFVRTHAATYPVALEDLPRLLMTYLQQLLRGSEFGTTLFGVIPYLLAILLTVKLACRLTSVNHSEVGRRFRSWDRLDVILLTCYASFLLFLNFFPNSFVFDRYYSAPRIFRYLTPLSFLMSLHLGKMVIDLLRALCGPGVARIGPSLRVAVPLGLGLINIYHAREALSAGLAYRAAFKSVVDEIVRARPAVLVVDSVTGFWLARLYLLSRGLPTKIVVPRHDPNGRNFVYSAVEHERWLVRNQSRFPSDTLLLTGLSNYVYYGAHQDGFRLQRFKAQLDPAWKLWRDYGNLGYLPVAEHTRLWRLSVPPVRSSEVRGAVDDLHNATPAILFREGMERYDASDFEAGRWYFERVVAEFPEQADDSRYFLALSYFREGNSLKAVEVFEQVLGSVPPTRWRAAAHLHTGLALEDLGRYEAARLRFDEVVANHPEDGPMVRAAVEASLLLTRSHRGLAARLVDYLWSLVVR